MPNQEYMQHIKKSEITYTSMENNLRSNKAKTKTALSPTAQLQTTSQWNMKHKLSCYQSRPIVAIQPKTQTSAHTQWSATLSVKS